MGNLTQAGRDGQFTSPLGKDALALTGFSANEALGELFQINIEAVSEDQNINFDDAIGRPCHVMLKTYESKLRFYHGLLTEACWTGQVNEFFGYRLVLRPWLWLLGHRGDCRIFLNKSVKDIIEEVFTKAEFSKGIDFVFRTKEDYDPIPYCVQYRETDLSFVHRLMEENGIYYFFEHSANAHTMVLVDMGTCHLENPDLPNVPYAQAWGGGPRQYLYDWVSERRFSTGRYELKDYDYLKPGNRLVAGYDAQEVYARSKYEIYDYPGKYADQERGENIARLRLEADQAADHRRFSDGNAPSLFPGTMVEIEEAPIASDNGKYLVVRCSHRFSGQQYRSRGADDIGVVYRGNYELLPFNRPFRIFPATPKPRVHGIQTAIVVPRKGDEQEEISTDENGHIWLQFHWDREPKISCPVRCAQSWAGKNWGEQFIPRIGMEVVVEFLEGDPDRPLVTGCVYNGTHKVPYTLPANKTQSGWKSDSSKNHQGYNELMFEDKKNSELIRMHAQRDHLVQINSNQTGYVGATELNSPYQGGDQTWTVGRNRTWTIQKGNDYVEVKQGNHATDVDMGNYSLDVKMGNISVKADLGKIEIEAMQSITLKVGTNSMVMNQMGVTFDVMNFKAAAQILNDIEGLMTTVKGNAMEMLKGGIILIG